MTEGADQRLDRLRRAIRERGNRLPPDIRRLARLVVGGGDDSVSHQEVRDLLPEYVDSEIAGQDIASKYPQVKQHLNLCNECSEQYVDLLEVMLAERAGEIPIPTSIPAPDLDFLGPQILTFPEFVRQQALTILNAIKRDQVPDLESVANTFFRRIAPSGGRFSLTFDAAKAMGFGPGELDTPLTILIVTFATTQTLVDSLSLDQINTLAAQNLLAKKAEEYALQTSREFNIPKQTAESIARQFAAAIAADPSGLRKLIELKNN